MSEIRKPTLFFIISPQYNLTAIESFLKKRSHQVFVETDVKAGLLKVIDVQPDFVFIALDHPNPKVGRLPQLIEQCITTNVIPFTHSSRKEEVRKLDESTAAHKIFPPMSGPAIERLTIKLAAKNSTVDKKGHPSQNLDQIVNGFLSQPTENQAAKADEAVTVKEHVAQLKSKNAFFANSKIKTISAEQKANLQSDFKKRFELELADILETYQNEDTSNVVPLHEEKKTIYCLLVQSEAWSGHLMAYSNVNLESHLLEPVFKNWVSQEFKYFTDQENHLFFDIEIDLADFKRWVQKKSEHFETLKVNDSELTVSFVGIEPGQLLIDFNEVTDLIEVDLEIVPLNTDLPLSLYLHLPENKKFLLYTPAHQQFSARQKQRLIENRVDKLHTPVQFEPEVKKLKMKKYLNKTLDDFRNESE